VALVRHGAHDELGRILSGRSSAVGLNAAGRAAVVALGGRLAGRGIAALQTSPQARTRETAALLGRALDLVPVVAGALDEIDFGAWSGRAFADLADDPAWARWNAARGRAPTPGGETMRAAVARAVRHLDTLGAQAGTEPVAAVSHCDIIRGVLAHYLGLPLDHILRFEVDPAGVCWLEVDGTGGARVLGVNTDG